MRYKIVGRSGLRVSELALGTMTFGEDWGWGASRDESKKIFDAYAEAGGNFIDTAVNYTNGSSEKLVGEFIASDRDHFVVATKYTLRRRENDPNFAGNHRKNLIGSLETSLKRLGTDHIDLYWLHAWDFLTPAAEVMRALDDQVRLGKILHVAVSDTPAWIVSMANTLAELRSWTPFAAIQCEYSLIERTSERDLLPMARALGLAILPWGILGAGILSGKYNLDRKSAGRAGRWEIDERHLEIAGQLSQAAQESGCSPSQAAIAWVRQQPGTIIPILGARSLPQLQDNLGALEVSLSPEQITRLEDASRIEMGFPHEFLAGKGIRNIIYGGAYDLIDR